MTLHDVIALAERAGVPPWLQLLLVLAAVAGMAWFALYRVRHATPDEHRKLLSADEETFRRAMLDTVRVQKEMIEQQDGRITKMTDDLGRCQALHAACEGRVAALEGRVAMLDLALRRATTGHD
jgi:hypothetical protein